MLNEPTIDQLRARRDNLAAELRQAQARLDAAIRTSLPFREGQIVEVQFRIDVWEPAIIRRVEVSRPGTVTYYGARRIKSGGFSARSQYIGGPKNIRLAP